jgi:hypothetical protein
MAERVCGRARTLLDVSNDVRAEPSAEPDLRGQVLGGAAVPGTLPDARLVDPGGQQGLRRRRQAFDPVERLPHGWRLGQRHGLGLEPPDEVAHRGKPFTHLPNADPLEHVCDRTVSIDALQRFSPYLSGIEYHSALAGVLRVDHDHAPGAGVSVCRHLRGRRPHRSARGRASRAAR